MATYEELFSIRADSNLTDKVAIAIAIKADAIRAEATPVQLAIDWANTVNPVSEAQSLMWALLASNKDTSLGNITGASDAAIQTAVDAAIDFKFVTGA